MSGNNGNTLGGGSGEPLPPSWSRPTSTGPRIGRIGGPSSNSASSNRSGGARIASLRDISSGGGPVIGRQRQGDDEDDEDDDGEGETFFAGGERSGLSVQNPGRSGGLGGVVRDLLRKAAQEDPEAMTATSSRGPSAFRGGGHTLGSDDVESTFIPDPNVPPAEEEETAIRHLTFWADGFSVEDGPLYRYDDPQNSETLRAIDQGQAPPQLLGVRIGQPVELRIVRRTEEEYKAPTGRAFGGEGQRLGSPSPALVTGNEVPTSAIPGSFPTSGPSSADEPPSRRSAADVQTRFEVDQTLPTTSIQIRLADGTRMVCRMNLYHTIGDIRNFINASAPENHARPYTIGTSFPTRILDDDSVTVEAAGLVNSVVLQRWA